MSKSLKTSSYPASDQQLRQTWVDVEEVSPFPLPLQHWNTAGEIVTSVQNCVRLDWEDLQCFEVVRYQFEQWGVRFENAIALSPSNSAYPAYSGMMVVMGAPKNGWVEAHFSRPVRFVGGFVTSPRRAILTAFDSRNQPVAQIESPGARPVRSGSAYPANVRLSLAAADICRVTFHTFNGHLTLDDFCFSL
ncbi:MAG: hypothetical protein Kow00121_16930 [Elainellaceae cyanobacterium]